MNLRLKQCGWAASLFGTLCLVNGQWAVLQVIAWSGMLISYSAESGLETGLRQTFDGNHPCPLCCAVEKATSESDADDDLAAPAPAFRLIALQLQAVTVPPCDLDKQITPPLLLTASAAIPDPPPTPPPRTLAG